MISSHIKKDIYNAHIILLRVSECDHYTEYTF